jgi:hypothetical protein
MQPAVSKVDTAFVDGAAFLVVAGGQNAARIFVGSVEG